MDTSGPASKHEFLSQHIGEWTGTLRTWPRPGSPPVESECTMTVSSMLEGRFIRVETSAEIPGVGPFVGLGVHGFDNATRRFQGSWIDSLHASVLSGAGELNPDADTLTWTITFICPLAKQPTTLRRIERRTGKDAMSIEFIETDPASGAERDTGLRSCLPILEGVADRFPVGVAAEKVARLGWGHARRGCNCRRRGS